MYKVLLVTNILGTSIRASSVLDRDDGMSVRVRYGCLAISWANMLSRSIHAGDSLVHCVCGTLSMVEGWNWQPYR